MIKSTYTVGIPIRESNIPANVYPQVVFIQRNLMPINYPGNPEHPVVIVRDAIFGSKLDQIVTIWDKLWGKV